MISITAKLPTPKISIRQHDLTGCPAVGSVWQDIENPDRLIEILGIRILDSEDYSKPVSIDISYRRQGIAKTGYRHPKTSTCFSSFTGKNLAIAQLYNKRRFHLVSEPVALPQAETIGAV